MDIKEYSYVLAVVENGSISEAARALYVSQPALSIYIRNLENRMGIKLFHKVSGNLHLTDAGRHYLEYAKKIVALDEAWERELVELKNLERGEVALGVTAMRGSGIVYKLLPVFREKYPGIKVLIKEETSVRLEELTYSRQLDISLLYYPFRNYKLDFSVLSHDEIVVVIPKDNPVCELAQYREGYTLPWIDFTALKNEEFVLLSKGQRIRQVADKLFEEAGFEPKVVGELRNAGNTFRMSAVGMGISITTADYCRQQNNSNIRFFAVGNKPLYANFVAAYPSREKLSRSAKAILDVIQSMYSTNETKILQ